MNPTPPNNPARRLRWLLVGFIVLCAGICGRLAALEWRYGAMYRAEAARPVERTRTILAERGRILARDGTVLACDRPVLSLAMQYRWLEEPPDPAWLRRTARAHLTAAERRNLERAAAEESRILALREALHRRLAGLCGVPLSEWQDRCRTIQSRVQALSDHVNRRAIAEARESRQSSLETSSAGSWLASAGRKLWNGLIRNSTPPAQTIFVAEQLQDHRLYDGLSLDAVAEIEAKPEQFPGVRIVRDRRRSYPDGALAAHLLGFVSATADAEHEEEQLADGTGRAGVERQYDVILRGADGRAVDTLDHHGQTITSRIVRGATAGRDLRLTLDSELQRTAETLLDAALARRLPELDTESDREKPGDADGSAAMSSNGGGAILAMDVHTGAILAAASAPRFDPALLSDRHSAGEAWSRYRDAPDHPLFDRCVQMALPPGSVFKTVTAIALLETPGFDSEKPLTCQGYLHTPDRQRCAVYRRWGVGHGPVTLGEALARSCNVYFFHYGEELGTGPLLEWSRRCGLGRTAGIDLPGESPGHLPAPDIASDKQHAAQDAAAAALAIGQSSLTVTPLQIVRLMAAVANGGNLVTPHVAESTTTSPAPLNDANSPLVFPPPQPIPGLDPKRLAILRRGLRQVVTDSEGTAHGAFHLASVEVAGKTGTAETGGGQLEHAWFAGYAPADAPKVAFVVVLEHAGEASITAAPAAAKLVEKLRSLGYFSPPTGTSSH